MMYRVKLVRTYSYECDVNAKDEEVAAEKALKRGERFIKGWEPEGEAEVELITEKYESANEDEDTNVSIEGLVDEIDRFNDLNDDLDYEDDWSSDLD